MTTLFERVVVTSTQVELLFSKFSHWSDGGGRGPKLGAAGLAARGNLTSFRDLVLRWRNQKAPDEHQQRRPPWTKFHRKGSKRTRLHAFANSAAWRSMRDLKADFARLPPAKQSVCENRASFDRTLARTDLAPSEKALRPPDDIPAGPMGLSS